MSALLTLARAWYVAGKPEDEQLPAMRTFTGWVKIVGGILKYAGVTGFLANLDELHEQADEEDAQWEGFLSAWYADFADAWITTAELCQVLTAPGGPDETPGGADEKTQKNLAESLPEWLQIALKEKPTSFPMRLAKALEKRVDACFGEANLRVEKMRDKRLNRTVWRIVAPDPGGPGGVSSPNQDEILGSVSGQEKTSLESSANTSGTSGICDTGVSAQADDNAESGLTGGLGVDADPAETSQTGQNCKKSDATSGTHCADCSTPLSADDREFFFVATSDTEGFFACSLCRDEQGNPHLPETVQVDQKWREAEGKRVVRDIH